MTLLHVSFSGSIMESDAPRRRKTKTELTTSMKSTHLAAPLIMVFVLFFMHTTPTIAGRSPAAMSVAEIAKLENPTLKLPSPNLSDIERDVADAMIDGTALEAALRDALNYVKDYTPPKTDDATNALPTLRICELCRDVTALHAAYQQSYGRVSLREDLKAIVEKTLLFSLKKVEWASKREPQKNDDYFNAYFSTLRRYFEVSEGWLLLNGKWTVVKVSR